MKFPLDFTLAPPRRQTMVVNATIPRLEPGESRELLFSIPDVAFRAQRLVANVEATEPQIRYYNRVAGSSRRRGALESARYFAELLRCRSPRPPTPRLMLTNLRIGANSQMTRDSSIPLSFFAPQQVDMGLSLDARKRGQEMTASVHNGDFSRAVWGVIVLFGVPL